MNTVQQTKLVTETAVSVGNTDTAVVGANTQRAWLLLQSDSDRVIYVSFGAAAALNTGIRLAASGTYGSVERWSGASCPTGAVRAISSVASKKLLVSEGS